MVALRFLNYLAVLTAPILFALPTDAAPANFDTSSALTISRLTKELVGAAIEDASIHRSFQTPRRIWYDESQKTPDSKAVFAHFMVYQRSGGFEYIADWSLIYRALG